MEQPKVLEQPNQTRFTLPGEEFYHTINSVVHAADIKPPYKKLKDQNIDLRNVLFEVQLDSFRAVAADGARLSVAQTQTKSNIGSGYSVTMYRINAKDMARMYREHENVTAYIHRGVLTLADHKGYMNLEPEATEVRLLHRQAFPLESEKFINWRKHVPYAQKPLMVKLNTKLVKATLREMFKGVTRKMIQAIHRSVEITMDSGTVTIKASDTLAERSKGQKSMFEYGEPDPEGLRIISEQVETTFEVETPKPRYKVLVSAVYLLDALNSIRDEEFMFAHGDESNLEVDEHINENIVLNSVSIFNVHYQLAPVDSPYLHIIMPMKTDYSRPKNSW